MQHLYRFFVRLLGVAILFCSIERSCAADGGTHLTTVSESDEDASVHAGLLGKSYLGAHYEYFYDENREKNWQDPAIPGFEAQANLPLFIPNDSTYGLGLDLFGGYRYRKTTTSFHFGPPTNFSAWIESKTHIGTLGFTCYLQCENPRWIRPYLQLGASYLTYQDDLTTNLTNPNIKVGVVKRDDDVRILVIPGCEFDLTDVASARISVDVEGRDVDQGSSAICELIVWPHRIVFFRGGVIIPIDGQGIGGMFGGGISF